MFTTFRISLPEYIYVIELLESMQINPIRIPLLVYSWQEVS